ncbi:MAG: polyamine aminopropyltransferase [Pseudomonadota bacterium]
MSAADSGLLVGSLLIVSACTLVYELLISALSSYFLGSSVLHFSITIGLFLFFMGVGSFLSRFFHYDLLDRYVLIEILIGLIGGLSGVLLYAAYATTEHYYLVALLLIAGISVLAGLEIPLVTRLLQDARGLRRSLSDVLAFDYLGALFAALLFPLVLVPYVGLQRTAFAVGLVNLGVAGVLLARLSPRLGQAAPLRLLAVGVGVILALGLVYTSSLTRWFEQYLYQDEIVHVAQTPYQRIVLTQRKNDLRLFLNGSLQFSSIDEYRYHEPLVHLAAGAARRLDEVLVLGGGDGLAVRELLRYPEVGRITVVDIDPAVTELASTHAMLRSLNAGALQDPRVSIVHQDAFEYLEGASTRYNLVVADLPDPSTLDLGKLYTVTFYRLLQARLAADGVFVTQASSPFFARKAYWCIGATLGEVFDEVVPVQSYVPAFGLWGFHIASQASLAFEARPLPSDLRFAEAGYAGRARHLPPDVGPLDVDVNRLENQVLVQYYSTAN